MADAFFNVFLEERAKGNIDWENDDIRILLVDTNYTFSASHATMEVENVPADDRVGDIVALSGKTVLSGGACDADNPTITSVPGSETIGAAIIFKYNTGTSSTDIPIYHMDSATGLDLATDGNNVLITFNASGIFK